MRKLLWTLGIAVMIAVAFGPVLFGQIPVQAGFPYVASLGILEPTISDVDGDGFPELLFVTGDGVIVINSNGDVVPGWTYPEPYDPGIVFSTRCLVGDVTGDGQNEIVVKDFLGRTYLMNGIGEILDGWPIPSPGLGGGGTFALIDSDGDGALEIASVDQSTSGTYLVTLTRGDGSTMPGWPYLYDHDGPGPFLDGPPAVADLDFDGKEEFLVGFASTDGFGKVIALQEGGVMREGWPAQAWNPMSFLSNFAMGDLDGDGSCEVFGYGLNGMTALRADGTLFWDFFVPPGTAARDITCADLDGDGSLEVVIAGPNAVRIFSASGLVLTDTWGDGLTGHKGIAIADVDGDGDLEIAYEVRCPGGPPCPGGPEMMLFLCDHLLQPLPGFPISIPGNSSGEFDSTMFADFDGDGDLELATAVNDRMHVFDLPAPTFGEPRIVWQQRGNTARGSFWYHDDKRQFFMRGDVNRDGVHDVSDAVMMLGQFFAGLPMDCEVALDTNASNSTDLSDVVYLLQFLYTGGASLEAPNVQCVGFPESDQLGCSATSCP